MIVGVMASDKKEALDDEGKRLAKEVGSAIAELGFHLLTGGGGGFDAGCRASISGSKKQELLKAKQPTGKLDQYSEAKELAQLIVMGNESGNHTRITNLAR